MNVQLEIPKLFTAKHALTCDICLTPIPPGTRYWGSIDTDGKQTLDAQHPNCCDYEHNHRVTAFNQVQCDKSNAWLAAEYD